MSDKLLNTTQVAELLGVSVSYLNKCRRVGGGPVFVKLGAKVVYDREDVSAWVNTRRCTSTSQVMAA